MTLLRKDLGEKYKFRLKYKEVRATTSGMFYCRDGAGLNDSSSNNRSCNLAKQCFEIATFG